jgi:hypothetical protein
MKKLHIALLSITVLLLASVSKREKPKVIYDATNKGISSGFYSGSHF